MRVARTERSKRAYRKLSRENRDRARKAIRQSVEDPRHPGLRVRRRSVGCNRWLGGCVNAALLPKSRQAQYSFAATITTHTGTMG